MNRSAFATVRTEGALVTPDFLQRLTTPGSGLEGLTSEDYHLPSGEQVNEAASRAWNRLLGAWTAFRAASTGLARGDAGTTATREKWLLPLFAELGFGRLQTAKAVEIEGRSYPVSHAWHSVPLHLVGCGVPLDKRMPGVTGATRTSPHGLVQELLNRSDAVLWGIVGNGLTLRLLRDNRSLTRQAYVEFDLAAMMDGQAYADFVVLWLLCHQSRFEGDRPEDCWLEKWATDARERGTRALDELRDGVERAISALGRGFLAHPANRALLETLRAGTLDRQDYYRQLLRLVYRLIFLFVAEDRELLLAPSAEPLARERYRRYYSIARLRDLAALRRGTPHTDLSASLTIVYRALGSAEGCPELGLPALGSFLWRTEAVPDVEGCALANLDLLDAIRALGFRVERGVRRQVDWRNLGPEELGSVYESLLELHPEVNTGTGAFTLRVAAGHERKTTGSYYTPTSLIECLLDSALDPVLDDATKAADPQRTLLSLKVCDPACGSGHFLIAAAHRIAIRLAAVRTGDTEAAPEAVRTALRDVIGHCLYGVDVNPMAVELCKVNLWLEALEPGRPLSFLDHHIQCGNALLGATPALLRKGIPDEAFDPIEGDDRDVCRELKKRNRKEREGFRSLLTTLEPWERVGALAADAVGIDTIDDNTPEGVRAKEARYAALVASDDYAVERLFADAWCTAFVQRKVRGAPVITEDVFRTIERDPPGVPAVARCEVDRLSAEYRFLHWHLAFPDVFRVPATSGLAGDEGLGWTGGFDVVLGNPPWERIRLLEKEWFAERRQDIAAAPNATARKRLIDALKTDDPLLWGSWLDALRRAESESALVRSSGRYPLCGRGDVNTYSIFAELNRSLIGPRGRAGFIVPTGIATDDTTKEFFQALVDRAGVASLFGFENEDRVFVGVHHAFRFCLLTLTGSERPQLEPEFAFFLRQTAWLSDPDLRFRLSAADITLLNPNTRTCPIFRTRRDAEITKAIHRLVPVLVHEEQARAGNPWGVSFLAMFHMSGDSALFRTAEQLATDRWTLHGNIFARDGKRYLPLYEAKMIHHFDHRFGTHDGQSEAQARQNKLPELTDEQHADPGMHSMPDYWVPEVEVEGRLFDRWDRGWLLGWRDITGTEKIRTVIPSVVPRVGVGNQMPLVILGERTRVHALVANLSSFVLDYASRQKVGGTHLNFFVCSQLPVIAPDSYSRQESWCAPSTLADWLRPRVLELVYSAWDLAAFGRDLDWNGPPFRWDPARRFLLRCELDAAFFHLYGICRDDADYIMDTFPIVRKNDEKVHGEYRTKRVILEVYDEMQRSIETGVPYQTRLDPPPADPRVAHKADRT